MAEAVRGNACDDDLFVLVAGATRGAGLGRVRVVRSRLGDN